MYGASKVPSANRVIMSGNPAIISALETEPIPLPLIRIRRLRRSAAGSAASVPAREPICT
ncbi:hypothetical protein [Nonomuraea mesophila]|uniref:hypothetical protein n=1 Tax=Nonomuraea mesophila TaxID=2530382 RepID=UPI001407B3AA|nr:hypothetical protein [Nonomuraea mesophila]